MGYSGTDKKQQEKFKELLIRSGINYSEVSFEEGKHNRFIEHEAQTITPNNLERKRWIVIDVRSFKKAIMKLNTKNSDRIIDYYLNLEEAVFEFTHYFQAKKQEQFQAQMTLKHQEQLNQEQQKQIEFQSRLTLKEENEKALRHQLNQKEEEIELERQFTLRLKEMLVSDEKMEPTQVMYISTSKNYAAQNRFKVGGVESIQKLEGRLNNYNSRSAQGDEFFFSAIFMVPDYRNVEKRLQSLIGRFRDKATKEIYIMHHTNLEYIVQFLCDHFIDEMEEVNEKLSQFIENLNVRTLRPIIPPPKEFKMMVNHSVRLGACGGVNVKTTLIDNEDFIDAVEALIKKLPEGMTEVTKKEIFDQLNVKTKRKEKEHVIFQVMSRLRPDIILLKREAKTKN